MTELSAYVNRFKSTLIESGINVTTDSEGYMEMQVPSTMSDEVAGQVKLKINIIDSLITKRQSDIS